jgi:putative SOS response-associated peptidase YedK
MGQQVSTNFKYRCEKKPREHASRMCGRFALFEEKEVLEGFFGFQIDLDFGPHYDIRPTDQVLSFAHHGASLMRWALLPAWEKSNQVRYATFNARLEEAATKPAFRSSVIANRRCVIPASGFYEWKDVAKKKKDRYYFRRLDGKPLAMAGLWDTWKGGGVEVVSCTILTTEANELIRPIHAKQRMPVILDANEISEWLDPNAPSDFLFRKHVTGFAAGRMEAYKVDSSLREDDKRLVEKYEEPELFKL